MAAQLSGIRWSKRRLACTLLLTVLCCHNRCSDAAMRPMLTWLWPCVGGTVNTTCFNSALVGAHWIYMNLYNRVVASANVTTLTAACQTNCTSGMASGMGTAMQQWSLGSSSCGAPTDSAAVESLVQSIVNFVCITNNASGLCVQRVASALQSVSVPGTNVWLAIRTLSPTLTFQNATLNAVCDALRPTLCCLSTWSLLMGAIAQQLCMPTLANEYFSLPGRCAALGNVVSSCIPNWDTSLLPAMKPRSDCLAWPKDSTIGSAMWTGTGCTAAQLAPTSCPNNACDAWCGIVGYVNTALAVPVVTASAPTTSSSNSNFTTGVIVFLSVFSGIVFLLLVVAAIIWFQRSRSVRARKLRERRTLEAAGMAGFGGMNSFKSNRESVVSLNSNGAAYGPASGLSAATSGAPPHMSRQTHMSAEANAHHRLSLGSVNKDRLIEVAMLPPSASLAGRSSIGDRVSLGGDSRAGRPSMSLSLGGGRQSTVAHSSMTARSGREELDIITPLREPPPAVINMARSSDPVALHNGLYGGMLPSESSTSGDNTPNRSGLSNAYSPPMTPPNRHSKSFSFGQEKEKEKEKYSVDNSPLTSVRDSVVDGEWRTAVGPAAALNAARDNSHSFPMRRGSNNGASAFRPGSGLVAAAVAQARASGAGTGADGGGVPLGRWRPDSNGGSAAARSPGSGGGTTPTPSSDRLVRALSTQFNEVQGQSLDPPSAQYASFVSATSRTQSGSGWATPADALSSENSATSIPRLPRSRSTQQHMLPSA